MSKEAMKLALEALEAGDYYIDDLEAIVYAADDLGTHEDRAKMQAAITVLRLEIDALNMASKPALAEQPAQQEPVAWMYPDDYERMSTSETFCTVYSVEVGSATKGESTVALYTSQPAQRKPLTDEQQIAEGLRRHGLTLVKKASGYEVLKLGQITGHNIKENT